MTIETRERKHAEAVARWQKQQAKERAELDEKWRAFQSGIMDARKEQERVADWCDAQHKALDTRTHGCEQRERELARRAEALRLREEAFLARMKQEEAEFARERTHFNEDLRKREAAFGFGVSLLEEVERRNEAVNRRAAELDAAEAAHDERQRRDAGLLERAKEEFRRYIGERMKSLQTWADGLVGEARLKAIADGEARVAAERAELDLSRQLLQSETQAWRDEQKRAKDLIRTASRQRSKARDMIRAVQGEAQRRRLPVPDMRDG